jgi:hypothetical protein
MRLRDANLANRVEDFLQLPSQMRGFSRQTPVFLVQIVTVSTGWFNKTYSRLKLNRSDFGVITDRNI